MHPAAGARRRVSLRGGASDRVPLDVYNESPLAVRLLDVAVDAPGLRIARLERDGPRTEGPTIDSLFSPLGRPEIPREAT